MSKITLPPLPEPWLYPDPRLTNDNYPAYTAEQMQERDRQIAECVIRACAEVAKQCRSGFGAEDAILAMLPVDEMPKSDSGHSTRADGGASTAPLPAWQPIETAPKDGTEVLLAAPGRVTYGHWLRPSDVPRIVYQDGFAPEEVWDDFEPHWMSWDGGFTEEHPPTHWMPLPSGPTGADNVSPGSDVQAESASPSVLLIRGEK